MQRKHNLTKHRRHRTDTAVEAKIGSILQRKIQGTDKRSQVAELLTRNSTFLEQLRGFSSRVGTRFFQARRLAFVQDLRRWRGDVKDFPLIKWQYPPIKTLQRNTTTGVDDNALPRDRFFNGLRDLNLVIMRHSSDVYEQLNAHHLVLAHYESMWKQFCEHWEIEEGWDGKLTSLKRFFDPPVLVNPDPLRKIERERAGGVTISIAKWARIKDIISNWAKIMKMPKPCKEELFKDVKFERFLLWYDLSQECGLSPLEIARLWNRHRAAEVDLLALRNWCREGGIDEVDIAPKALRDDEYFASLLTRIRSGDFADKYSAGYDRHRLYYSTGKEQVDEKLRRSNIPLVEVIRKAISRIDNKIRTLDKAPPRWFVHSLG